MNKENVHLNASRCAEAYNNPLSTSARQVAEANALVNITNKEMRQRAPAIQPNSKTPHIYRKKKPEQVFKTTKFTRDNTASGINAYVYTFKVIKPLLIPYIRRVQAFANTLPYRPRVVLIKDNVSLHKRAWAMLNDIDKEGIDRCEIWPSRSPELNMIEPCWHYLKRHLPSLEIPNSAAEEVQQYAIRGLGRIFNSDGYLQFAYKQLSKLQLRATQVHEHHGQNNFNA